MSPVRFFAVFKECAAVASIAPGGFSDEDVRRAAQMEVESDLKRAASAAVCKNGVLGRGWRHARV